MPIRVHTGQGPPVSSSRPRSRPTSGFLVPVTGQVIDSIRQVIFLFGPVAPRTLVSGALDLALAGVPGDLARTSLRVCNSQSALAVVSPALTVLIGADGCQWSPQHEVAVGRRLLWPGERTTVDVMISIAEAPTGCYDGYVVFFGVDGRIPIHVTIRDEVAP